MKITIEKLAHAEHHGDWHDKPTRWQAVGPGDELQKFATKRNAQLWAKIRRRASSFLEASCQYAES